MFVMVICNWKALTNDALQIGETLTWVTLKGNEQLHILPFSLEDLLIVPIFFFLSITFFDAYALKTP